MSKITFAHAGLGRSKMDAKRSDGRHCDLCGSSSPKVRCDKCLNQIFCLSCDDMYHRHPKRSNHVRKVTQHSLILEFLASDDVFITQALDVQVSSVRPPLPPKGDSANAPPPLPPPRKTKKGPFSTPLLSRKDFSV